MASPEYNLHAAAARHKLRGEGFADCIHFAPRWQQRAEALFNQLQAHRTEGVPDGEYEWPVSGPALTGDGRMAVVGRFVSVVELLSDVPVE